LEVDESESVLLDTLNIAVHRLNRVVDVLQVGFVHPPTHIVLIIPFTFHRKIGAAIESPNTDAAFNACTGPRKEILSNQ